MRGPWIAWILSSAMLPALPFLIMGKRGLDEGMAIIVLAILAQLGCSIWLAVMMGRKLKKGRGFAVLMTIAFMTASTVIGTVSFFASCLAANANMNFH